MRRVLSNLPLLTGLLLVGLAVYGLMNWHGRREPKIWLLCAVGHFIVAARWDRDRVR